MSPRFAVRADEARAPFAVALDVGSGGTRAALYDACAREVGPRAKISHAFTVAPDGTSTIDADQVVAELREALEGVLAGPFPGPVAAVGLDTFASSFIAVGADGSALTPCITYADSRSRAQADALAARLDADAVHDRTGARLHASYLAPRLLWLRERHPEVLARTVRVMDLGEYAAAKLLGAPVLGTAAAAWTGMLDRRTGGWDAELLAAVGADAALLGEPRDPAAAVPIAGTPLARRLPGLGDAVWVPSVGDGLAANLGIGALGPGTWGISTATSGAIRQLVAGGADALPTGLWAYRVDTARTLVGSAISDCGRLLDWALAAFAAPAGGLDPDALLAAPPDPAAPLVIPFLSGERGTRWRGGARAMLADVSAATTSSDLLRGSMEGLALSFARIAAQMRELGGEPERIVVSGGMTGAVPGWLQILADALGAPIDHVAISRSTMRGTAVLALEQVAPAALPAAVPVSRRVEPVPAHTAHYRARLPRFEALAELA